MPHFGLFETLVTVLMLIGLAGCILPVLPGSPVMWLGFVLYCGVAWIGGDITSGQAVVLGVATFIAAAGTTAEWWLSGYAARKGGASRRTTVLALASGLLALLFVPFGGFAALAAAVMLPALVVFALEYHKDRDRGRSARAGCGYMTGWMLATVVELAAGISLMALWLWQLGWAGAR